VTVPLQPDAPLLREWAVVVVAPSFSVVLTAWEVPDQQRVPPPKRRFETVLSFDPAAVRVAADVCVAAARSSGAVDPRLLSSVAGSLATEPTGTAALDAVVVRAFEYLQDLAP
jgi:DICT domain-containing protein